MAKYYGTIQGNRGKASRCGTKTSGLRVTANSWSIGAEVSVKYDPELDADVVYIYTTTGSNSYSSFMMKYAIIDGKLKILDTKYPELLV